MLDFSSLSLKQPLLIHGDAFSLLKTLPQESVDVILTSPPYFGQREILGGPFQNAKSLQEYLNVMKRLGKEFKRVLKPTGSLWLNIGDCYREQSLLLVPSRVALIYEDQLGLTLRNDVIWEKRNYLPSAIKNRTTNSYEHFFHFTMGPGYYVNKTVGLRDTQTIDAKDRVVSKTGITGENYKRKIESSHLTESEKSEAFLALQDELNKIRSGEISDFRLLLRSGTSILHSQRKAELKEKGYAFIESKIEERVGDVWNIGTSTEKEHDSPFPEELLTYPILSSCPKQGIILDPFVGSGTTLVAAIKLHRKAIGIEIREDYFELAKKRIAETK